MEDGSHRRTTAEDKSRASSRAPRLEYSAAGGYWWAVIVVFSGHMVSIDIIRVRSVILGVTGWLPAFSRGHW